MPSPMAHGKLSSTLLRLMGTAPDYRTVVLQGKEEGIGPGGGDLVPASARRPGPSATSRTPLGVGALTLRRPYQIMLGGFRHGGGRSCPRVVAFGAVSS